LGFAFFHLTFALHHLDVEMRRGGGGGTSKGRATVHCKEKRRGRRELTRVKINSFFPRISIEEIKLLESWLGRGKKREKKICGNVSTSISSLPSVSRSARGKRGKGPEKR